MQASIQSAQWDIESLPNESSSFRKELERQLEEQERRRKIYNSKVGVPKREKIAPLKSANRRVGKAKK